MTRRMRDWGKRTGEGEGKEAWRTRGKRTGDKRTRGKEKIKESRRTREGEGQEG